MASSKSREIERAINLIHEQNQARAKIFDKLQERKADRDKLAERIRSLLPFAYSYESRRRRFEYTEQTFLDFYSTIEVKPNEPPSIKTLYCKTRHGSNCLANEKKIFRDITTTLKTRKEIGSSKLVNNKVLNNQTHFMRMTSNANVERLKQKIQVITNDIRSIENHLDRINKNKVKIYAQILKHHKANILG
ncbi:uncharacterized protein [Solanum tuberosum]|uniref:uncharacterized protein n=1 Tax=Solanum tuberosum TaxID=4113 RepID=UPI00073A1CEA|nr:PREDICTED: uncharacterized protein LOC107060676 [Solanum tuberosum]